MSETKDVSQDVSKKGETQYTESAIEEKDGDINDEYEQIELDKDKYIIAKPKRIIIRARIKK